MQYSAGQRGQTAPVGFGKDRLGDHRGPPITVAPVAWTCSNACSGEKAFGQYNSRSDRQRGFELEHTGDAGHRTGQEQGVAGVEVQGVDHVGDAAAQAVDSVDHALGRAGVPEVNTTTAAASGSTRYGSGYGELGPAAVEGSTTQNSLSPKRSASPGVASATRGRVAAQAVSTSARPLRWSSGRRRCRDVPPRGRRRRPGSAAAPRHRVLGVTPGG